MLGHDGPQPARRPVDRQVRRRSTTSAPTRYPHRSDERLPVRATTQIAQLFDSPGRARPLRDPLRRAQLGGPGRPPRRARLARRRPGPGAVRDRRARACAPTARPARRPASSTSRPRSPRCSAARPRDDGTLPRGPGRRRRSTTCSTRRERPRHVVGFLFDGTNPNVLYDMAARGEAPNVARLIEMGTAFGHGAMAALPDGHAREPHVDHHRRAPRPPRHPQQRVVRPRDRRAGHHQLAGHLAVGDGARSRPASSRSTTRCTARGPTRSPRRSTSRATSAPTTPPSTSSAAARSRRSRRTRSACPHTTERFVRPSKDYSWSSIVDHMGVEQARRHLGGHYRDVDYPLPRFMWCNFTLTDAAMHEGGPHSEIAAASVRDSDGRVGEILAAVEQRRRVRRHRLRARRRPRHGGERPDVPRRLGRRAPRGRASTFRDEAYGFLYLGACEPSARSRPGRGQRLATSRRDALSGVCRRGEVDAQRRGGGGRSRPRRWPSARATRSSDERRAPTTAVRRRQRSRAARRPTRTSRSSRSPTRVGGGSIQTYAQDGNGNSVYGADDYDSRSTNGLDRQLRQELGQSTRRAPSAGLAGQSPRARSPASSPRSSRSSRRSAGATAAQSSKTIAGRDARRA